MLNRITILGRLTRDPELRRTQSGVAVTTITVAVDRDYKSSESGEREADFFNVVAWRQTAEFVSKYFSKGRVIGVDGRMQSRKWQDKSGNNRVSWEIQAENVYFGGEKPTGGNGRADVSDQYSYGEQATETEFKEIEENGELPF